MSNDKVVSISSVTKRLIDVATKGEEKKITATGLLQKFMDGEASASQVVTILNQNGVWQDMLLGAIAFSMGITPKPVPGVWIKNGGVQPADLPDSMIIEYRFSVMPEGDDYYSKAAGDLDWNFDFHWRLPLQPEGESA